MTDLPVILLHAFPLNCALWADQAAALRAAGYDVRTPDLPGFGASPVAETEPDLDVFAGAVLGAADAAGFDRFVLGGLSMGGYTSMAVLRRAPERVAALILADTRATADSEESAANRRRIADELEAGLDRATFARAIIPTLVGETTLAERPDVIETVRAWIEANDPRGIAWAQRAMALRPDSVTTLAAYEGPALIVWGEEDTLTNRADQDPMLDALDDVELAMIPSAGHLTAIESPDAVTGVLLEFLASL
ncbi:MAG: alpha/beta hydrolase [Actinomycetes bacterium]